MKSRRLRFTPIITNIRENFAIYNDLFGNVCAGGESAVGKNSGTPRSD